MSRGVWTIVGLEDAPQLLVLVDHDGLGTESMHFDVGAVLPPKAWRSRDIEDTIRMHRRLLRADQAYFPMFGPVVAALGTDGKLAALLVPERQNLEAIPELGVISRTYGVPIRRW